MGLVLFFIMLIAFILVSLDFFFESVVWILRQRYFLECVAGDLFFHERIRIWVRVMINWEFSREVGGLPGKCGRSLFLLFFVSFAVKETPIRLESYIF